MKKVFPKYFKKVCDWLIEHKNIDVQLATTTSFMGHFSNRIFIHRNYNLSKNGLIALLHECGHALQPKSFTGPNDYKNIDQDDKPKEFKMGRFLNEVDAWDRGWKLAKELNIPIDENRWNKLKKESLLTYYT